jgi:hypothetical protein
VWYFGEGFSGLTSGHASLITGAPGSALLLALLAGAAWPTRHSSRVGPARSLPLAWAALWIGSARSEQRTAVRADRDRTPRRP